VRLWIPDNLTSAVTRACRYEPTVQRDYQELAEHYGAAILPARPYKPRDKAKVEVAVQIEEDKLRPLPKDSLELSETKEAKVQIDSHVAFEGHSYSAPLLGTLAAHAADPQNPTHLQVHALSSFSRHHRIFRSGEVVTLIPVGAARWLHGWDFLATMTRGGSMKSLSRLISVAGLALFVLAAAPQSATAQQLGNAVNTAKTVATKVAPLASKAAPVAGKAVQAVRGKPTTPAQPQATATAQPQATAPAQPPAQPTVTDRAIGAVRGLAGGTPAAAQPAAAPRPAPAGAPPG
jgi:hypothetical protein